MSFYAIVQVSVEYVLSSGISYVHLQLCLNIFPKWFLLVYIPTRGDWVHVFSLPCQCLVLSDFKNFSSLMCVNILINFLIYMSLITSEVENIFINIQNLGFSLWWIICSYHLSIEFIIFLLFEEFFKVWNGCKFFAQL